MLNASDLKSDPTRIVRVAAGSYLLRHGDPSHFMYIMIGGHAEIRVAGRVVERAQAGAIVGELAMIDRSPRSAEVYAVTDCEFVEVDEERFDYLVRRTPHFARHVLRVMATRLRRLDSEVRKKG